MNRDVVKEYQGEVEFFCKNIRGVINHLDSVYSMKDIENDLWVLVFETVRDYGDAVNIFLIRKRFRNHLIRLLRGRAVRINVLPKIQDNGEMVDIIENSIEALYSHFIHTPDDIFDGNELLRLVDSWVSEQDDNTKRVIRELLTPSPEVLEKWEEIAKKTKMYRNCKRIPASVVSRILGIKFREHVRIMRNMKNYLRMKGYEV
jgi:hypothetical protein